MQEVRDKMQALKAELDAITIAEDKQILAQLLRVTTRQHAIKEFLLGNNADSPHVPLMTDDINSLKETINDYRGALGLSLV